MSSILRGVPLLSTAAVPGSCPLPRRRRGSGALLRCEHQQTDLKGQQRKCVYTHGGAGAGAGRRTRKQIIRTLAKMARVFATSAHGHHGAADPDLEACVPEPRSRVTL